MFIVVFGYNNNMVIKAIKNMSIKKLSGFLFLYVVITACSDDKIINHKLLVDCDNHYRAQSYLVALKNCETAAKKNIAQAQWLLAHIYRYDLAALGARPDLAFEWYLKAAEAGLTAAQTFVGESYLYADGVSRNYESAFSWLSKAADNADTQAEFTLGQIYLNGEGRDKDISSAIFWFNKAALKEHSMSINNLAWLYATSAKGGFFNVKKARYWSQKLKDNGLQDPSIIWDTKAAVFAAGGEFDKAIEYQNKAIENLAEDVEESLLIEFQKHLEAYQNQQAWKE